MSKRIVISMILAVVMLFSLGVSSAAAGSAVEDTIMAPWYHRWQPFPVEYGWRNPIYRTGLNYSLSYTQGQSRVTLFVTNNTNRKISVRYPTSQKVDFVLWKDGKLVWRSGADKMYTQAVNRETFKPGETKRFAEDLPWFPTGTYYLQAYYLGESRQFPVVSTWIWFSAPKLLEYDVNYLGPSWFNPTPRLRVTIKNTSGRDIALPYQYGYQILIKKAGSDRYLGNVGMSESLARIENGATRYVFVPLRGLEPGWYVADVRSNIMTGRYITVAQTWFYVGR
jgi:hypothetical protein